jgi:threonine 3-dehydrogenase
MMKALIKTEDDIGLTLTNGVAEPEIGPNDVLVKIEKTAICGTDLHIYFWDEWAQKTIKRPTIIGHEFYGKIVSIGSNVEGLKIGMRVSGEGHLVCGQCRNCRAGREHFCRNTIGIGVNINGAFANYMAIPAHNIIAIPDDIADNVAAILDPLGNAMHTALTFDMIGEDVLITGAGPIGLMSVLIARKIGARKIVVSDPIEKRRNYAAEFGADFTIDSKKPPHHYFKNMGMIEGFDVGLEMSGHPKAINDMIASMNHGGNIALLGLLPDASEVNWNDVIFHSLTLKGIYGREMFETWYKMIALLQSGLNMDKIITHVMPYQEYKEGFNLLKQGDAIKVVLDWT